MTAPLAIVTATTNLERARACISSWRAYASNPPDVFVVLNGHRIKPRPFETEDFTGVYETANYLGSVPAFRRGVDLALNHTANYPVIACLHDDYEIEEPDWDLKVDKYFGRSPNLGLAGFGGAVGLGAEGLYDRPYDPMSLARQGFRSNLGDAESHGLRSLLAERVACLDGFSQVGRREFWSGYWSPWVSEEAERTKRMPELAERPWATLERLGFIHHFYDGALGCLAARLGWEAWYLPLRSMHYGGRTAVGDAGYQAWAEQQDPKGDQGFWEAAHRIGWTQFKDVLPLRV